MSSGSDTAAAQQVLLDRAKHVLDDMRHQSGSAERQIEAQSEFTSPAHEYLIQSCFGGIWDREGLEKKYRSLTVISILASTGKIQQMKSHVKMGMDNGLKVEEIRECLMHVMGYCGFPAGLDAFAAADEVIKGYTPRRE